VGNIYTVIAEEPYGFLVRRANKKGEPLEGHRPFWACPFCFDLDEGGGILVEPEMYCSSCGFQVGDNIDKTAGGTYNALTEEDLIEDEPKRIYKRRKGAIKAPKKR
jgi:hypothetical protein